MFSLFSLLKLHSPLAYFVHNLSENVTTIDHKSIISHRLLVLYVIVDLDNQILFKTEEEKKDKWEEEGLVEAHPQFK